MVGYKSEKRVSAHFDIFDVFNSFNTASFRQIQLQISVLLKFHDLRLRRFGLVLALSPSVRRQCWLPRGLVANVPRRGIMDHQRLTTIDEPGATAASSQVSAGDEELVAAAKDGNELAFEAIVKRHRQRIFGLALRYTRSQEDAEDVVQQTFHRAFIHLLGFEGRSSFSTWLSSIAINHALMLLRKRHALRELPIDDSSDHEGAKPALEIADASPDPEASYLKAERARLLCAAVQELSPGMLRAVELQELGELTTRETAQRMGLSVSAVKARLFRARKSLAKSLRCHARPNAARRASQTRLACA
jgi:RNA polymerase sigma-70 factor (ECF subfamily)